MNEYHKRMWNWSYAPRLFCRHPSVSVSGIVAASLLGNVFLWVPSMWLPGEQSFSEDGGFSQEDGDFSRGDQSQHPTACRWWRSGVQHLTQVEPTGALPCNVWTWDQKGWSALISGGEEWGAGAEESSEEMRRSICREAVVGTQERGALGSWACPSGGYRSLVWARLAWGATVVVCLHCGFCLHCCHLRTKDSDWHKRHFRTWTSEWVICSWGTVGSVQSCSLLSRL